MGETAPRRLSSGGFVWSSLNGISDAGIGREGHETV
jgi:hypothetical protein